jgi:hypothetical protein
MASHCTECREENGWGTKTCPVCGAYNPTGINTDVLWMISAAAVAIPAVVFGLLKGLVRAALHHQPF